MRKIQYFGLCIVMSLAWMGCSTEPKQVTSATETGIETVETTSAEVILKQNPIGKLSGVYHGDLKIEEDDEADEGASDQDNGFVYIVYGNDRNEYDEKIILYPASDWTDGSQVDDFASALNVKTDMMIKYLYSLTSEMNEKIYVVVVDGKGRLNDENIVAFTLGYLTPNTFDDEYRFSSGYSSSDVRFVKSPADVNALYHFALTESGEIYLYKQITKEYADLPDVTEMPKCTDVGDFNGENEEGKLFYYEDYVIGISDNGFERGGISLPQAIDGLNRVIQKRANTGESIVLDTLESVSGMYDLVMSSNPDADSVSGYRLNGVEQIDGISAYSVSYGNYKSQHFKNEFIEQAHYLVSQNGKIYTYAYKPERIGNITDLSALITEPDYLFVYEYDDDGMTAWSMNHVSQKTAPEKCGHDEDEDDEHVEAEDDSDDENDDSVYDSDDDEDDDLQNTKGGFCKLPEIDMDKVQDYIEENYINKYEIKSNKSWLIYFGNNGDFNGEETYEIYVGHELSGHRNKLNVLYRFTVTRSGKIYQMDKAGNRKQVYLLENTAVDSNSRD